MFPLSDEKQPQSLLFDLDDTLWAIDPVIAKAETILDEWPKSHTPAVAKNDFINTFHMR